METILIPETFICYFALAVVQFTETIHTIVLPLPNVSASFCIDKCTSAMALAINCITLIAASVLIALIHQFSPGPTFCAVFN